MCERAAGLTRRELVGWSAGAAAALLVPVGLARPAASAAAAAPVAGATAVGSPTRAPAIRPRADWAAGIAEVPGLPVEAPGDVRVLLVHHSATSNTYGVDDVAGQIASFHRYHTTSKGWPDVAYNFFVDRHGVIWEGRSGSLAGPVIGDATGGNQGFTQLCCFVGDHTSEAPTSEAQVAMTSLLAFLADRYGIDPTPGATATFTSRGSNRWAAGEQVTTPTIEGHRSLSSTACPGDAAYALVQQRLPVEVAALVAAGSAGPATTAPPEPPTTEPAPSEPPPTQAPTAERSPGAPMPTSSAPTPPVDTTAEPPMATGEAAAPSGSGDASSSDRSLDPGWVGAGLGAAAVVGTALAARHRAHRRAGPIDPDDPAHQSR